MGNCGRGDEETKVGRSPCVIGETEAEETEETEDIFFVNVVGHLGLIGLLGFISQSPSVFS